MNPIITVNTKTAEFQIGSSPPIIPAVLVLTLVVVSVWVKLWVSVVVLTLVVVESSVLRAVLVSVVVVVSNTTITVGCWNCEVSTKVVDLVGKGRVVAAPGGSLAAGRLGT